MPEDETDPFTRGLIADVREHGAVTSGPLAGRPLMILSTTGAKTGKPRTAIVTYTRDGDRYVIAGSKSGAPTHPAWYHNLVADPSVTVEAGGEAFPARARVTGGDERARLWDRHAAERTEFREYPNMTARVIPVIVLERAA
ncbi:MAG: nitroreductase family deazaflavin-dependent oxidoreductase [Chloroflexota bacterium]